MAVVRIILMSLILVGAAWAEQTPFIEIATRGNGSLFSVSVDRESTNTGSLFSGQGKKISLLAPYKARRDYRPKRHVFEDDTWQMKRLRALIEQAESRQDGYNAVQHGATVRPKRLPTQMTLAEIFAWIKNTPGQPHAIGRYQFIPKTLARLVDILGIGASATFSPALQDRLADVLLREAGLQDLKRGDMSRQAFMKNLAKIWAGLPMENGRSYYHGYAGNKASISWAKFDAEMAKIFPS